MPVQQQYEKLRCGVAVVDTLTGRQIGLFEFTEGCTELYDVQFLPNVFRPMILNADKEAFHQALTAPAFSYWLRPSALVSESN